MNLLFDENLSPKLIGRLNDLFPGSIHVRDIGLKSADDISIWEYAFNTKYTIVTQDSDFYEMSLLFGSPPKIIWLRCGNTSTKNILKIFKENHQEIIDFLNTVESDCMELL